METSPHILVVMSDSDTVLLIERNILSPEGYRVSTAKTCAKANKLLKANRPDLIILGDKLTDGHHIEFAERVVESFPTLPIVLFTSEASASLPLKVVRLGLVDWLTAPLHPEDVLNAVQRGLQRNQNWEEWLKLESRRYTGPLEKKVDELETLAEVGRSVTSQLDLDRVLTAVVDSAVQFSGAEEGSILLLDEETGDLYMHAARNFQDEFVRTFRLPVEDTLAGEVIQSGEPVMIDAQTPQKIQTAYLVHALIYVPLKVHGRTIGVLGVDNRETGRSFDSNHLTLISAMADYAAIAIENAQLYSDTEVERSKLQTILTQIEDGVVVLDADNNVLMLNPAIYKLFELANEDFTGKPVADIFTHEDFLEIITNKFAGLSHHEIEVGQSRVYSVQVSEIPEIGRVATLHDISYLKELDRVKSDFVNAVSHDLRSPLTAIMGYVELIERVGEVNDRQKEFIDKVQQSVRSITNLIDDLLDLGRIEVGMDDNLEDVPLSEVLNSTLETIKGRILKKNQTLNYEPTTELPTVSGNPVQLRQMFDNIVSNAVKYTPEGGS
ncbi:MAG: GAF domain-containing protein, partial [Anaerolineae bacterium]|nr:GAF domain-containing protein [Anaerolineae bacterium]